MDFRAMSERSTMAKMKRVGEVAADAEAAAVNFGTNRVYGFRIRHPWVYGLIAFIIGSSLVGIFTMTTYTNWEYESIDLKLAIYQVVLGALGGGILMVILAFAYAHTVQQSIVR